jgi:Flp pilus assembly protein TadB
MSKTAYICILISLFVCFFILFLIVGVAFEEYCSRVATKEGRQEELLQDSNGEDWGPYRTDLFRRLYKKSEDQEDPGMAALKRRVAWGFNFLFILMLCFVAVVLSK